jgi:hypothetical protein
VTGFVAILLFLCNEQLQVRHDIPRTGVDELDEDALGFAHVAIGRPGVVYLTNGLCDDLERLYAYRLFNLL